jgi:hypothetical protein
MNRANITSHRSMDPSGWDRTDDPSVCSTLEPSRRNLDDAESVTSSPKRPIERTCTRKSSGAGVRTAIPHGDDSEALSANDIFYQEDRDLEKGETDSAMRRRRKHLREKRWYSCLPIFLVFIGAACLGGGIYAWWLYLGPGKETSSSTGKDLSGSGNGDAFSGPNNMDVVNMASSNRPMRDEEGSKDVV